MGLLTRWLRAETGVVLAWEEKINPHVSGISDSLSARLGGALMDGQVGKRSIK